MKNYNPIINNPNLRIMKNYYRAHCFCWQKMQSMELSGCINNKH